MSDIFLCYSRSDVGIASKLEQCLKAQGWSVFIDRNTRVGQRWHKAIEAELHAARAVVVLWSAKSRDSDYVLEEAEYGKRKEILFPAFIEQVEFPYGFGRIQTADLIGWGGENDHPGLEQLLEPLRTHLGDASGSPSKEDEAPTATARKRAPHASSKVDTPRAAPAFRKPGQTFRDSLNDGGAGRLPGVRGGSWNFVARGTHQSFGSRWFLAFASAPGARSVSWLGVPQMLAQRGQQAFPFVALAVAIPADQVERLKLSKSVWDGNVLDAGRKQDVPLSGLVGFVQHEAAVHGMGRPKRHHGSGSAQFLLNPRRPTMTCFDVEVHEDFPALGMQAIAKPAGEGQVFAGVTEEDVGHSWYSGLCSAEGTESPTGASEPGSRSTGRGDFRHYPKRTA